MTVVTKHPEWAGHVATQIGNATGKPKELRSMAIAFATDAGVQGAIADGIGIHHAFLLPVVCYLYIVYYAFRGSRPVVPA